MHREAQWRSCYVNNNHAMNKNNSYVLDSADNLNFLYACRNNLLKFGIHFPAPSGSSYWLGSDGTPCTDRERETWITARMAHVYSLASMLGMEGAKDLASKAISGLSNELYDEIYGGWYAAVTPKGTGHGPKQCYAHAFVILAACSAELAGIPGAAELRKRAEAVYDQYFWQDELGLSVDSWNREFTILDTYRGLNANMHTVEAFLADADATGQIVYRERAGKIIAHVIRWAKNADWRIPEHYNEKWSIDKDFHKDQPDDKFKPYGVTPGHGIEWARLILQWALSTFKSSADYEQYLEASINLYHRAMEDGWNVDGKPGIVYTTDWNGCPVIHDRMHWTLAEAINTSAVLFHVTHQQRYADDYYDFMKYLDEKVWDHNKGSWFHRLDKDNRVVETGWSGKCDLYHATQSTLIPLYSPAVSIAAAVQNKMFFTGIG